jgi:hypothetical protein
VQPQNSSALAQALASVLDRNWEAEVIRVHGGRSWETVAEELLEVFLPLADRREIGNA